MEYQLIPITDRILASWHFAEWVPLAEAIETIREHYNDLLAIVDPNKANPVWQA